MLEVSALVQRLVERRLLEASEILEGEVRILDASRRNRNLHLLRQRGPSYMIKHGLGAERRRTVAGEAEVYDRLAPARGALAALLPRVHAYLPDESLLVTELVAGGQSLERRHVQSRRFSHARARMLGEGVAMA